MELEAITSQTENVGVDEVSVTTILIEAVSDDVIMGQNNTVSSTSIMWHEAKEEASISKPLLLSRAGRHDLIPNYAAIPHFASIPNYPNYVYDSIPQYASIPNYTLQSQTMLQTLNW